MKQTCTWLLTREPLTKVENNTITRTHTKGEKQNISFVQNEIAAVTVYSESYLRLYIHPYRRHTWTHHGPLQRRVEFPSDVHLIRCWALLLIVIRIPRLLHYRIFERLLCLGNWQRRTKVALRYGCAVVRACLLEGEMK